MVTEHYIVEDVLVQVDKFYYPVDFVVLDMQQPVSTIYQAPVILGRPFLATSNALINCRSGVVKLTFGNMALELNVFNACKMPAHFDDTSGLNAVESLTPTKFICSNSPFSDNEDDFEFFDCFADSSLPFQETERIPSEWSTQNKRRFLSEQRKQFQKFCKSRWSGPYIVNPREVF